MVKELITQMHKVLNLVKDFEVSYSTGDIEDGYMLIEYKGKRYAVRALEIKNPSEQAVDDVNRVRYFV